MLDPLFSTGAMSAAFSERARLQGVLDFEAALARAEARCGVIPPAAAAAIAAGCRADLFDAAAIADEARLAGNLAIPIVRHLGARVGRDTEAARFVHHGATSQDALDTGAVLQMRVGLDLLDARVAALARTLRGLAVRHRSAVMPARTWLQHALPTTFGLKAAGWLDAVRRHRARLSAVRPRALVLQLGGAAGTLAGLGDRALAVSAALADELRLPEAPLPWHAHRDGFAEIAAALGLLTGTLGKIARDLSLLMQTEVGEAFEPAAPGRGGSSTMPHKRNPVGAAVALAAAARVPGLVSTMLTAMVQEHERGLGGWHAEWETLPEIFTLTAGALEHVSISLEGLDVRVEAMANDLALTRGLPFAEGVALALAPHLGRAEAHGRIEAACHRATAQGRPLRAVLNEDPLVGVHLPPAALDLLFDPSPHVRAAEAFVDRVLALSTDDEAEETEKDS